MTETRLANTQINGVGRIRSAPESLLGRGTAGSEKGVSALPGEAEKAGLVINEEEKIKLKINQHRLCASMALFLLISPPLPIFPREIKTLMLGCEPGSKRSGEQDPHKAANKMQNSRPELCFSCLVSGIS